MWKQIRKKSLVWKKIVKKNGKYAGKYWSKEECWRTPFLCWALIKNVAKVKKQAKNKLKGSLWSEKYHWKGCQPSEK